MIQVLTAPLLFTKYNTLCMGSTFKTNGSADGWTVSNELQTTIGLWVTTWLMIIGFFFCACSAGWNKEYKTIEG